MIDFINDVFSRAFSGGSCGGTTRESTHNTSKRVKKSPKKKGTKTTKPSPSRRTVVRFAESRDENSNNFKRSTSLLDMTSASGDDSEDRDSAMGSREMLLQEDNPLAIMERGNLKNSIDDDNADNSSEEVTEGVSFETISNLQQRLEDIDNVRKRGIEQIGKFLPSLSFDCHDNDDNNNSSRRNRISSEDPKLLETLERMKFIETCPQCADYLKYSYISSPGDLVDINEGRDSLETKLRNLMPPYCDKCNAHLLFDHTQTKKPMIENLDRWLEMNANEQTKGKIIFIGAPPTSGNGDVTAKPRVTIEYTPKGSKRGLVSFSFQDIDVNPLYTTSSLTDPVGLHSRDVEPESNNCSDYQSNKTLFPSDNNQTPATKAVPVQNEIQIVSTESEERAILQQYSVVKDMATDSITKHLKMHYELTSDLCDRCQMPMMKMGDSLVYCIVCPVVDESAKRSAKKKRKKIQKLYGQNLPTRRHAPSISSELSAQQIMNGNARLTALEEGFGFIYSPTNQVNDIAVSSCMSNDDHEPPIAEESDSVNLPPVCNSLSSDNSSFPSVQVDPSQDHDNNQYSIGIEYTYSVHQQNLSQDDTMSQNDTAEAFFKSGSMSSKSNTISQASSSSIESETKCPRNLPPSQACFKSGSMLSESNHISQASSSTESETKCPRNLPPSQACFKSGSMLSESNHISQASSSTESETKCPRNLPPSQMIWSPVNNAQGSVPFNFDATSTNFMVDEEEEDGSCPLPTASAHTHDDLAAPSDRNNIVEVGDSDSNQELPSTKDKVQSYQFELEYSEKSDVNEAIIKGISHEHGVDCDDKIVPPPVGAEGAGAIEARIARISKSMRNFTEATRNDESDLGTNHQQSFEEPLLRPHMFRVPEYNVREGPNTSHEYKSCDRKSSKKVRVFGQTMIQASVSQCENSPPLFPSPNDVEPALEVKEEVVSTAPIGNIDAKASTLFLPPENSSYNVYEEKAYLEPRNVLDSVTKATASTFEGSPSSSLVGYVRRERSLNSNRTMRDIDPVPSRLPLSRSDYAREASLECNQSAVLPTRPADPSSASECDSSPKRTDPPGKRLTKPKRSFGDPLDPPEFASTESLVTPKRNNTRNKARIETFNTRERNTLGKSRRQDCSPTSFASKPVRYARSKQYRNGSPLRNVYCNESKSTYYESSPRGASFRDIDSNERESKKRSTSYRKQSKRVEAPIPTSTEEHGVIVTIPTWVNEEIVNSPLKSANSDSSVDKLIQQIDDIEADFGSVVASLPESSSSTLEKTDGEGELDPPIQTTSKKTKDRQVEREVGSPIAMVEIRQNSYKNKYGNKVGNFEIYGKHASLDKTNSRTQTSSSEDSSGSDVTENSVLTSLAQKLRRVRDQIDRIDSSDDDSDDDESIDAADSQEEMLQLLNRLNNAAESLRTFADFQD